jgi:hypothetical protein
MIMAILWRLVVALFTFKKKVKLKFRLIRLDDWTVSCSYNILMMINCCFTFLGLGEPGFHPSATSVSDSIACRHSQAVDESRRAVPVAALVSV